MGRKLFGDDLDTVLRNFAMPKSYDVHGIRMILAQSLEDDKLDKIGGDFIKSLVHTTPYRIDRMNDHINSTGTIVDIGGNIGSFTVYSALAFTMMDVYVFEPSPIGYFTVVYNLYLNGFEPIMLLDNDNINNRLFSRSNMKTHHFSGDKHFNNPHLYHPNRHDEGHGEGNNSTARKQCIYAFWGAIGPTVPNITIAVDLHDSQLTAIPDEQSETGSNFRYEVVPVWKVHGLLQMIKSSNPHNTTRIDFLKMDCEGCEFDVVVQLGKDFFPDRNKLPLVGMELHLSLMMPNEKTVAKKPIKEAINGLIELMNLRGCNTNFWEVMC